MNESDTNLAHFNDIAREGAEREVRILDVRSSLADLFIIRPLFEVAHVALGRLNGYNDAEREFAADVFLWRSSVFFLKNGFNESLADMINEVFMAYSDLKQTYSALNKYLLNPETNEYIVDLRVSTQDEPPTLEGVFMT